MDDSARESRQDRSQTNQQTSIQEVRRRRRELQRASKELQSRRKEARELQNVERREPAKPDFLPIDPNDDRSVIEGDPISVIEAVSVPEVGKLKVLKKALIGLVAFIMIGIPTILGIIYFGFFASDQYVAEARFAIRSQQPISTADPSGMTSPFSGLLGSPIAGLTDAQIVVDYLQSDQLLKDISDDVNLRTMYSVDKADWWSRLDADVTNEGLLDYWRWLSTVEIDPLSGIVTLTVRGFTPQDAKTVSDAALFESEKLVNRLSERSQADAIKSATEEVKTAYERVIKALDDMQRFQEAEKQINPLGLAQARSEIQSKLEGTLAQFEAQLASLQKTMSQNAPTVVWLKNQISAVKAQIDAEKLKATASSSGIDGQDVAAATKLLAQFDKLNLEREFAGKAYLASLTTLENAKMEANRQSRYLEAFVRPQLPQEPRYPNRPAMMLFVAACSVGIWLLTMLIGATIREHI